MEQLKSTRAHSWHAPQQSGHGDPPPECQKRCEELKEKLDALRDELLAANKKITDLQDELLTETLNARIAQEESQ